MGVSRGGAAAGGSVLRPAASIPGVGLRFLAPPWAKVGGAPRGPGSVGRWGGPEGLSTARGGLDRGVEVGLGGSG